MSAVANASIARKMFPVLWETGGEIAHHPPYAATPELQQTLRSHARPPTAPASGVQPEAETALCDWDYPGNVRELANVLERVLVLRDPHDPSPIDRDEVTAGRRGPGGGSPRRGSPGRRRGPGRKGQHRGRLAPDARREEPRGPHARHQPALA